MISKHDEFCCYVLNSTLPKINSFLNFSTMSSRFWANFGSILGQFWVNFGSILDQFWVNFGSILGQFWVNFRLISSEFRANFEWFLNQERFRWKLLDNDHFRRFCNGKWPFVISNIPDILKPGIFFSKLNRKWLFLTEMFTIFGRLARTRFENGYFWWKSGMKFNKIFFSGGVFTNSDVSVVPLARKADIMIMKNKSRDLNELDDMR